MKNYKIDLVMKRNFQRSTGRDEFGKIYLEMLRTSV